MSDPDRRRVNLRPRATTIAAIAALDPPHPVPTRRRTPFQRQAWQVVAQVVQFQLDGDGSVELTLFDAGAYVRAEMPPLECLSKVSRARQAVTATRARFVAMCGKPRREPQSLGAVAYVTGVGFWSPHRSRSQAAANGAELQPITNLRLIVGCR